MGSRLRVAIDRALYVSLRSLVLAWHVELIAMDWIEKLTGWTPDGGDGSAETAIVLVAMMALAAAIGRLTGVAHNASQRSDEDNCWRGTKMR